MRAGSGAAYDAHTAALKLRQLLDYCKPETGATRASRSRLIDTIESLKDLRHLLGADAAPFISNEHLNSLVTDDGADMYDASVGRTTYRVFG